MDALQIVRRQRSQILTCGAVLAVSCGAAMVVSSFLYALWLRPSIVPDAHRVFLVARFPRDGRPPQFVLPALSMVTRGERGLAAQIIGDGSPDGRVPLTFDINGVAAEALAVNEAYFEVLGQPITGRAFVETDFLPGAPPVAIISHRFWQERFQGTYDLIGGDVAAVPHRVRIVGIAPAGFSGAVRGERTDVWIPSTQLVTAGPSARSLLALNFVRLAEGVTPAEGLAGLVQELGRSGRRSDGLSLVPLPQVLRPADGVPALMRGDDVFWMVSGAALLLLTAGISALVALLLVDFERRTGEFAVRLSLGATPKHLWQQVLTELAAIAVVGALGALAFSGALLRASPHFVLPDGIDLTRLDLSPDTRLVAIGVAMAVVTVAIAAVIPLRRVMRRRAWGTALSTLSSVQGRQMILGVHAGATMVLMVMAVLFVKSLLLGLTFGAGFDDAHTLFLSVRPGLDPSWSEDRSMDLAQRDAAAAMTLMDHLRQLPGVEQVTLGRPLLGSDLGIGLTTTTTVVTDAGTFDATVSPHTVGLGYLETLGIPLMAGRPPTAEEFLISSSLADLAWPGESPIGRHMRWGPLAGVVAGVIDVGFVSIRSGRPTVFVTFDLDRKLAANLASTGRIDLAIRAKAPGSMAEAARRMAVRVFPHSRSVGLETGRDLVLRDLGRERLGAWFLSFVGTIAWLLGIASVFGLVAYVVERRRRDFGVMLALGAARGTVFAVALRAGLFPVLVGSTAGLVISVLLAGSMESLLLGVAAVNVVTYGAAFGLFTFFAATAALVGAWRVRRIAPAEALRVN